MIRIFSIAVYDSSNGNLHHDVVRAEDEFDACTTFTPFWELVTEICSEEGSAIPEDMDALKEFCNSSELEVSIVEVK